MSISEQVKELREYANFIAGIFTEDIDVLKGIFNEAADTIESLSAKLADMERSSEDGGGGWIPCSEPPKHDREVLIFNGKSYSVGYYDGKTWVNAIHPVEWQEIRHEP